jgi:hypothetical protein
MRAALSATTIWLSIIPCCLAWQRDVSPPSQTAPQSASQPVPQPTGQPALSWERHHAVVLLGLPGDKQHEAAFRSIANDLHRLLTKRGLPSNHVILFDHNPPPGSDIRPATRESITETFQQLTERLTEDDAFWLFFIGHADHDGENARFHIPGPDLRGIDYADLLRGVRCREQVYWLTMSSSGRFLEPLSQPNRVVVTATLKDAEPNETEFPAALVEALALPVSACDRDDDQQINVLELFAKVYQIVEDRYRADDRAATEHAMIDDNGDGRGTEWKEISELAKRISKSGEEPRGQLDGQHAARIFLAQARVLESESDPVNADTVQVDAESLPDD